ncbi:MAG TPA: LLM class F420-dependent oxidoreductase [Anaerolineales bacterium]|nr:LLM class F420-dependent oxidoreductase [Anaerolineales bacterium]
MKLGLQIERFDWPGSPGNVAETLANIARAAEESGLASLWTMDHFFQIEGFGEVDDPMLEAYATLGYLAAVTRRIRLGALVTGVVYRYPGILVKTATTIDVLTGGRSYFGIGVAWFEREALALGVPFPSTRTRFELLEEALQVAHQMWSGSRTPHRGQHLHLEEPISSPQPLTRPHPPILIGGEGERKTLRLVAQYGDACNVFADDLRLVRRKLDVLHRHCDEIGRPYEDIERTALGHIELTRSRSSIKDVISTCQGLASAGIQHFMFTVPEVHNLGLLEVLGREVVPAAAEF